MRLIRHDEATGIYLLELQDESAPDVGEIVWCMADGGRPSLPARGFVVERLDAFKFTIMDASL